MKKNVEFLKKVSLFRGLEDEKLEVMKSARSIESGLSSTTSRFTINSKRETEHFIFYYYDKEPVVGRKHTSRPRLMENDKVIFRAVSLWIFRI